MARSEELPGSVKAFIVQRLDCFAMPSQVVKAVKEEFGPAARHETLEGERR
jgi:hypothetical protein